MKYYMMRIEVGLSTDMFFHSSEYCAAINAKTQYYQKSSKTTLQHWKKTMF